MNHQTIAQLQDIGRAIAGRDFDAELVYNASRLFWHDVLRRRDFEYEKERVKEVEPVQIDVSHARCYVHKLAKAYRALSKGTKRAVSFEEFRRKYERTLDHQISVMRGEMNTTVGHYNVIEDICYVSQPLPELEWPIPSVRQTEIAVHELTHRYIEKERGGSPDERLSKCLEDGQEEEETCRRVELVVQQLINPRIKTSLPEARRYSRDINRRIDALLDPERAAEHTRRQKAYWKLVAELRTPTESR